MNKKQVEGCINQIHEDLTKLRMTLDTDSSEFDELIDELSSLEIQILKAVRKLRKSVGIPY